MEQVIAKLSKIEHEAATVTEQINLQKRQASKQLKQQITDFDTALQKQTMRKIEDLKKHAELQMESQIKQQKQIAESALSQLQQLYDSEHEQYANQIFESMIGG